MSPTRVRTFDGNNWVGYGGVTTPVIPAAELTPLWQYPGASDSFWNMPVGSGLTYLPTTDPQHVELVDAGGVLNYTNWTDPVYLAAPTDPLYEVRWVNSESSANYTSLKNTDVYTITGNETWSTVNSKSGLRIPDAAKWWSTSNTDRKVHVVQSTEVTVAGETYPAGAGVIEMHQFLRTTTPGLILCTYSSMNNLTAYGLQYGAIASGISPTHGLIRPAEMDRVALGDVHAIAHVLRMGLPFRKLLSGPQWPSRNEDGNASTEYYGKTRYGTMLVLDAAFDIEAATYLGQPLTLAQKALGYCLQDYGGYVLIAAGSGPITLQADPLITASPSMLSEMNAVWNGLFVQNLRIATNSVPAGPYQGQYSGLASRMPTDRNQIAGGGVRRRPYRATVPAAGPYI